MARALLLTALTSLVSGANFRGAVRQDTTFAPGWRNGNSGVARPGGAIVGSANCGGSGTEAAAPCCFDACMANDACAAWSVDLHSGACGLKGPGVPAQAPARDAAGAPLAASGVKAAAVARGLRTLKFSNFKLGSVRTAGWLRTQLILMTNGLSGHLESFWDDIADSVWIGGVHDHSGAGHERGPYWLNGVVPLAAHLNATGDTPATTLNVDMAAQVNKWVFYILVRFPSSRDCILRYRMYEWEMALPLLLTCSNLHPRH